MKVNVTRTNRLAGPKGSKSITACILWLWLAITRSQTSCSMHDQLLSHPLANGLSDVTSTVFLTDAQCSQKDRSKEQLLAM